MDDIFYYKFELKYRGSEELIKSRLSVYLPFILPFKEISHGEPLLLLDLGCGRGEWLELVKEHGFSPLGVDTNVKMVEICRNKGLNVKKQDALNFLANSKSNSYTVVTAFHLIEHIHPKELYALVKESFRILKPGGILILETPNPENLSVGTSEFYSDPSHKRPVHPSLLSFIVEQCGFLRQKIVRLQEPEHIKKTNSTIELIDVIKHASPDYAVVAQKGDKSGKILALFDTAFENVPSGVTVEQLAERYHKQIENQIRNTDVAVRHSIEDLRHEMTSTLTEALVKTNEQILGLSNKLSDLTRHILSYETLLSKTLQNIVKDIEHEKNERFEILKLTELLESTQKESQERLNRINELEAKCLELERRVQALLNSWSWRVTYPLRKGLDILKLLLPTRLLSYLLASSICFVIKRSGLRSLLSKILLKFPPIYFWLYNFAVSRGICITPIAPSCKPTRRHNTVLLGYCTSQTFITLKKLKNSI